MLQLELIHIHFMDFQYSMAQLNLCTMNALNNCVTQTFTRLHL